VDDLEEKLPSIIKKTDAPSAASPSRSAMRSQEEKKRKGARQRNLYIILVTVILLANAVLGYFLYGILITNAENENTQTLIDKELTQNLNAVATHLSSVQNKLDQLAQDAALVEAIAKISANSESKDPEEKDAIAASLAAQFEASLKLNIFMLGEADVNPDNLVPIRFAELDLIRRAEGREKAAPEAAQINGEWQIHFISAVVTQKDKTVLGTLLLTLNAKTLNNILSNANSANGEVTLQQKFSNSTAKTIFKFGTNSANESQEREIPNSNWLIRFTPSDSLIQQATVTPILWAMIVLGSFIACLFAAFAILRHRTRREKNKSLHVAPTEVKTTSVKKLRTKENDTASTLYQQKDILDIAMINEDEDILGLHDTSKKKHAAATQTIDESSVPIAIFRSYDIRGIVGIDLNADLAEKIGQAIGSIALDKNERRLIVAQDARIHSQELTAALIRGILKSGCDVINVGVAPTPLMYFATYHFDDVRSGVMVTASHNPADYNGFKVVINNSALSDASIVEIRTRILTQKLHRGEGKESFREIIPQYIERIFADVALAGNVSLVIDAGNAVTGVVAPSLFEELGCEVTRLYCELDGTFPNHDPDPTQEKNLQALIAKVKDVKADVGVAFDGDGDRLVVVTPKGDIIWPDRLLMLFAKDILARNPGADVLFDVKCSRQLNQVISGYGGRPIMCKTGHSPMKAKMLETGALIGGEYSGHIFIKDRWYGFDDGIYAMARLLEIITLRDQKIDDIFAAFPQLITTPEIKIAVPDSTKFDFMQKLIEKSDFKNGTITLIDGIRVDYIKGWGLVRASNTSPALTLRFEAESDEALEVIKQVFKRELLKIDNTLELNF
jgi:phosphomannomutase / phosphoglucomutase